MSLLEITLPALEWMLEAPLIALIVGATLGVAVEAVVPRASRHVTQVILAVLAIATALGFTIHNWSQSSVELVADGTFAMDGPAYFFWTLLLIVGLGGVALFAERTVAGGVSAFAASAATVPGSPLEREAEAQRREHTEVFPLLLFSLFGMLMFASANDLLTLFVALEVFSLPLYLLSGMARRRRWISQEAALKYFLLGAFSSAFFLFGVALLYGYAGSFTYRSIAEAIATGTAPWSLLLAGLVMLAVGLLFKVGAVPFHSWTPDVYTGAPTPVTGFMAIATKTAAVAALLRVFYVALGGARWDWAPIFATIAVATMAVGAFIGLVQNDIKRLLAYSSIAHAGFILAGVVAVQTPGDGAVVASVPAIGFYLLAYGLATLGAFAIITMVRRAGGEANSLAAWQGIGRSAPGVAAAMTLFMLSFAGIPLTAGFVGKLLVFSTAWSGGYGWLVLVAILASLVTAFFYLKVVVAMWFKEPTHGEQGEVVKASAWTWGVVIVAAAATVFLGLVPGGILDLAASAAQFIR
ncbi:MAG: NADH-quinone oxidoreductase subunit NuoN [Propionibacteriaceae bacterium]|nr:NADH-quinone oxidoreductase subunit NuoN [Propionibacteriaceae bacterium]